MFAVLLLLLVAPLAHGSVGKRPWGTTEAGQPVSIYTIGNSLLRVRLSNYGARIVSIETPDRLGHIADIVLGFNDLSTYEKVGNGTVGAVVGRFGNRIAKGTFMLEGATYHVPLNN